GRKRRVLHWPKRAGAFVTGGVGMTTSSDIGSREDSGGLFATPPVVIHESQHDTSTTSTDTKIDSSSLPSTGFLLL
ncbi:hypothetical protein Tco_0458671, partial [Tanacetum coccineum]